MTTILGFSLRGQRKWLVGALLLASGCAANPASPAAASAIHEGELALELGKLGQAIRILEQIPESDPSSTYAAELLVVAHSQMERIVIRWFNDVDQLVAARKLSVADARLKYVAATFPLNAAQRTEAKIRAEELKVAYGEALRTLADAQEQAADYMLQHQPAFAASTLWQVKQLAWHTSVEKGLTIDHMIAAAELRLRQGLDNGTIAIGKSKSPHRVRRPRRSAKTANAGRKEAGGDREAKPATISPAKRKTMELLRVAQTAQTSRSYYDALRLYRQVLVHEPENSVAKIALRGLKGESERLVKINLAKANAFFLRQELTSALPFYERVLQLEPQNKQALEGKHMYDNLQRIRRRQGS